MLARGSLGNPWRFERLLGLREGEPTTAEVLAEINWVIERCREHLGAERGDRYLRKFYPWYAERLGLEGRPAPARDRARQRRSAPDPAGKSPGRAACRLSPFC